MLYHFPIEPYIERYTSQLCGKGMAGWLESRWLENDVPFVRISPDESIKKVEKGSVLDATGRSLFCFEQLSVFLRLLKEGVIREQDVLYFPDFWTPGVEALAYAFHLLKIKPKMYSFCHAQSVDPHDFTFEMLPWIRYFEKGNGAIYDGVFVNSYALKNLLVKQGVVDAHKVHVHGHLYNSDRVKDLFPKHADTITKKKQVVFSSRWDKEKDPMTFLKLAKEFRVFPDLKFIVTTSFDEVRSNDQRLVDELYDYPFGNLEIRKAQTKTQYYETLLESKFQFNCADQDFISYCLLEALTCQCIPIYPNYLSFPEVLPQKYLYDKGDVNSAFELLLSFSHEEFDPDLLMIVDYHDTTWQRITKTMIGEYDVQNRYSD